ncbi:hypothetical protein BBJ28_00007986 [Nothophytophthora sp. Chile5]|nr:hypothetical protein BBJ28_00007986 [Nothophytophthora sp. Chile5]
MDVALAGRKAITRLIGKMQAGDHVDAQLLQAIEMALPGVNHLLVALRRLLLRYTEILRDYVAAVSRSPLLLQAAGWLALLVERPWFRKGRNVVYHCAAFVVGSTYEDEREAFSAQRLVRNDAYRDRLLVPEIEDLVALCDALSLTLAQRKAFFQCFLHVDFMRRSSVSRAELLRYCGLRATPLSAFLLPNAATATHRAARNRWDILQLLAACFSVCTAELAEVCARFAVCKVNSPAGEEATVAEEPNRPIDFLKVHGVTSIVDVVRLFPGTTRCCGREQTKPEVEASKAPLSAPELDANSLIAVFEQCSTVESAWRVTANHALASVFIQCCHASVSEGDGALITEFQRVTKEISDGKLGVEQCERIRLRLVGDYGYRFAQFLLEKSSLKELSHASKTPLEERRAQQRYSKAWSTSGLVDDKTVYWKEFEDPVAKRAFYYNVRTGESRWEKPVNFVSQSRLKKRKKRRKTDDGDRTELVKVTGNAVKAT